jgi:glycosyltransferase 2 family protein
MRPFLTLASFAAAFGVSVWVIRSTWPAEGAPLGLPWLTHLMLVGVVVAEAGLRVIKLQFCARALGMQLSAGPSARTVLGGDFAAGVTPSRSGAEPVRFLVLKESGMPTGQALLLIFVELFLEFISLAIVAVILAIALPRSTTIMEGLAITVALYATGVFGAAALAFVLARHNATGPPPRWIRALGVSVGLWRRIQRPLRQVREGAARLKTAGRGVMSLALLASVLHVAARLAVLPIILYAYGERPAFGPLVLWPLVLLYGAAVAPAPAGGGVVELGFKAVLGGAIPGRLLATSLIWWRVYTFYIYLVIGAFAAGRTVMNALAKGAEKLVPNDENETEAEQARGATAESREA